MYLNKLKEVSLEPPQNTAPDIDTRPVGLQLEFPGFTSRINLPLALSTAGSSPSSAVVAEKKIPPAAPKKYLGELPVGPA